MPHPDQNSQTLIAPIAGEVTVHKVAKLRQEDYPATLFCTGITSGTVTVSISPDGGESFIELEKGTPNIYVFTATQNILEINSPMTIGVTKAATTPDVGVFLNKGPRA